MTDDVNDARDERLAARLQTEPLDDVTRARLVRNALTASEPEAAATSGARRRSSMSVRWQAAAAAVVALAVSGVAVVARDDSDSAPTAARAPKTTEQPSSALEVTPKAFPRFTPASGQAFSATIGGTTLGDLGDVSSAAALRRAVTAALPAQAPASALDQAAAAATPTASAPAGLPTAIVVQCPAHSTPPAGTTIA